MILNETFTLNNGVEIPKLALGTWLIDDASVAGAVRAAIGIGYRHIDTAQAYGNERGVGEAVRTSGVAREELFVVSKVAAEHKTYEEAAAGIERTLATTGLDYLDMMIIHSPQPWAEVNQSQDRHVEGNIAAYRALEDALGAGRLRAIGVSNFLEGDLRSILDACEVRPAVNQVLAHVGNVPFDLARFCADEGILVEAYSPIAHGEAARIEGIAQMAAKYGVRSPSCASATSSSSAWSRSRRRRTRIACARTRRSTSRSPSRTWRSSTPRAGCPTTVRAPSSPCTAASSDRRRESASRDGVNRGWTRAGPRAARRTPRAQGARGRPPAL